MHRPGADCFLLARKRGNARGAKGAGHPHRTVWSTGNRTSRVVRPKAAAFVGGTSRVSRETHARICERLGVKFPGPTRHVRGECPWSRHDRGSPRDMKMDLVVMSRPSHNLLWNRPHFLSR